MGFAEGVAEKLAVETRQELAEEAEQPGLYRQYEAVSEHQEPAVALEFAFAVQLSTSVAQSIAVASAVQSTAFEILVDIVEVVDH